MKKIIFLIVMCLQGLMPVMASEQDVIMIRSRLPFPEAMTTLQNSIIDHQYTLSRVQRVDIGLEKAGYTTDRYRIVFFGKHKEMKAITDESPQMGAYLPLKVAIFAEEDDTMLVVLNPLHFQHITDHPEYNIIFKRWASDIKSILEDVRKAE